MAGEKGDLKQILSNIDQNVTDINTVKTKIKEGMHLLVQVMNSIVTVVLDLKAKDTLLSVDEE